MPPLIRKAFAKQLRFLLENRNHPSLHAKKYSESLDVWQARVTRDWRFPNPVPRLSKQPKLPIPDKSGAVILGFGFVEARYVKVYIPPRTTASMIFSGHDFL